MKSSRLQQVGCPNCRELTYAVKEKDGNYRAICPRCKAVLIVALLSRNHYSIEVLLK